MSWGGAVLTDSGGFQVFSLGERGAQGRDRAGPGLVTIAEEGVTFRSHLDGSRHFLSPERAIEVQEALGADVIMAFDECPPSLADRGLPRGVARADAALARPLPRCVAPSRGGEARGRPGPMRALRHRPGRALPDLRARAIEEAAALDLPGYALGGYAVGEAPAQMWEGVARDAPQLPADKPRYLMGVGTPEDLLAGVAAGVDMFDCVLPTADRTQRAPLHEPGQARHPQRPLRRRRRTGRPVVRLLHLPHVHPRLPPPPLQGRRDPRAPAQHLAQPALLPVAHGRGARRHRAGPVRAVQGGATAGVARGRRLADPAGRAGGPPAGKRLRTGANSR